MFTISGTLSRLILSFPIGSFKSVDRLTPVVPESICRQYGGIDFRNTQNGELIAHKSGEELFLNKYGKDIGVFYDKIVKFGEHRIPCSSFAWKCAVRIKAGVLMPVAKHGLTMFLAEDNVQNPALQN